MTLRQKWHYEADKLDAYAKSLRRDHYYREAEDAEQAATD
jgi:hypothetical protein